MPGHGSQRYAFVLSGIILSQNGVLLSENATGGPPAVVARVLTGFDELSLAHLMQGAAARRTVYGLLFLSGAFSGVVWLGLWFNHKLRAKVETTTRRLGRLILVGVGMVVFVQLLQIPLLYGYLVVESEFETLETHWRPPAPASAQPTEETTPPETAETAPASAPKPTTILILGYRRGRAIVYSPADKQVWLGIDDSQLMPARRLPPRSPFRAWPTGSAATGGGPTSVVRHEEHK